jgi:hypothetical protein
MGFEVAGKIPDLLLEVAQPAPEGGDVLSERLSKLNESGLV